MNPRAFCVRIGCPCEKENNTSLENMSLSELEHELRVVIAQQQALAQMNLSDEVHSLAYKELQLHIVEIKKAMHSKVDSL